MISEAVFRVKSKKSKADSCSAWDFFSRLELEAKTNAIKWDAAMPRMLNKKIFKQCTITIIMIGIILPCIVVVIKKVSTTCQERIVNFLTPTNITCSTTNIHSKALQAEIDTYIREKIKAASLVGLDTKTFYKELRNLYPIIKSINWCMHSFRALHITITGASPVCIINNQSILSENKRLFPIEMFQDTNMANLTNIQIDNIWLQKQKIDTAAYDFIKGIPQQILAKYAVTFHKPNNIELIPNKSLLKFRIITDTESLFDHHKFETLSDLFANLSKHHYITKKTILSTGIPLTLDFRIRDQIIVKFHQSLPRGKGL